MAILLLADFLKIFDTERIKQLASERTTASSKSQYDATIAQTQLDQADAFVVEYLSKLYTRTQIEAEVTMQRVTASIAMYYLERRRLGKITESIQTTYNEAVNYLTALTSGRIKLATADQVLPKGNVDVQTEYLSTGFFDGMINEERVQ